MSVQTERPADSDAREFDLYEALVGRVGVSTPGSRSSSPVEHGGQSVTVASANAPVGLTGIEHSYRLSFEGQPRLPPPMSAMILDPPRSAV